MKTFETREQALAWMTEQLNAWSEFCIDNERFAFMDEPSEVERYERQRDNGCCGFLDEEVIVAGRQAMVGCNYGH